MKKTVSIFLAFCMVLSLALAGTFSISADPADTWDPANESYVISTADDMMAFAAYVEADNTLAGKTVTLAGDIDLSGKDWKGVGYNGVKDFCGTFDGQGHTISGLTASTGNSNMVGALFASLNGAAVVKNFILEGTITSTRTSKGNNSNYGTVAARIGGDANYDEAGVTIQNVLSKVNFDGSHFEDVGPTDCGVFNVGGIVGCLNNGEKAKLTIDGCVYAGTITSNCTGNGGNRPYYCGGLVGYIGKSGANERSVTIQNSVFAGAIDYKSGNHIGGLIGGIVSDNSGDTGSTAVTVKDSYVCGSVSVKPAGSGRGRFNGYLVGAFQQYTTSSTATLSAANGTQTLTMSNVYYIAANYSTNGNTDHTFEAISGTTVPAVENLTDVLAKSEKELTDMTASSFSAGAGMKVAANTASAVYMPYPANAGTNGDAWESAVREILSFEVSFDPENPTISSAAELDAFAAAVNAGNTFAGKTVVLTADIDIGTTTSWIGIGERSEKPFCGTFDGQGHTISMNWTASSSLSGALFRYLGNGAIVKNFTLTGTQNITGGGAFMAQIANAVVGTVTIQNVRSCVRSEVTTNLSYSGAFVGFMENNEIVDLTIDGCVFDGVINCANQTSDVGGFVGYMGNNGADRSVTIRDSIMAGSISLNDKNVYDDIGGFVGYAKTTAGSGAVAVTISDCIVSGIITYNTEKNWEKGINKNGAVIGNAQDGAVVSLTNVYYVPIDSSALKNDSGETVQATLSACGSREVSGAVEKTAEELTKLTAAAFTDGTKWGFKAGIVQACIPCPVAFANADAWLSSLSLNLYDASDEFSIATVADFRAFEEAVDSGKTYAGKTVKLAADLDFGESEIVWDGIGSRTARPFCGTFDGQGHTINMNWTVSSNITGAIFCYLGNGAIVKNFTLTGTQNITGGGTFMAQIANAVVGTVTIQNVRSSVRTDVTTNISYSGSMVGFMENNEIVDLTIDGCVFDGVINCANQASRMGAFVGYTGNTTGTSTKTLTIKNCISAGTFMFNDFHYTVVIGQFVGYIRNNGSAVTAVSISDSLGLGTYTFDSEKNWADAEADRPIGALVGGFSAGETDDDQATATLAISNVYYMPVVPNYDGTELAGFPLIGKTHSGMTASLTKVEEKSAADLAKLTTADFANASAWTFKAADTENAYIPCLTAFVPAAGWIEYLKTDAPEVDPGEQPGEQPGENPGEQPGENPGEQPGENPGEQPGENTTTAPVTTDTPVTDAPVTTEEPTTEKPKKKKGCRSTVGMASVTIVITAVFGGAVLAKKKED